MNNQNNKKENNLTKTAEITPKVVRDVLLVLVLITLFGILQQKQIDTSFNANYQQEININDNKFIANKVFLKDNKLFIDFNIVGNDTTQNTSVSSSDTGFAEGKYEFVPPSDRELTNPVYFNISGGKEAYTNKNSTTMVTPEWLQDRKILDDNYVKGGETQLLNEEQTTKLLKENYLSIAIYDTTVNKENIELTDVPTTVIQVPTSKIYDYVDVSNFLQKRQTLAKNPEEYKKYVDWILANELSSNLLETYFGAQIKSSEYNNDKGLSKALLNYKKNVNNENFDDCLNEILVESNKNTFNLLENGNIINYHVLSYQQKIYNNIDNKMTIVNNEYVTQINRSMNNVCNQQMTTMLTSVEKNKEKYSGYQEYKNIKDTLNTRERLMYLISICPDNGINSQENN